MKDKQIIIIAITVLFIVATGILYCFNSEQMEAEDMIATQDVMIDAQDIQATNLPVETVICVYICGQVKEPGVYEVKESDRVSDLIKLAGGLSKQAAAESVNLAQHLLDGQQIYIPSKEEAESLDSTTSKDSSLVNINTADLEALMTLPGIGEAKANSILQYREEKQRFQSVDEIKNIEGIKDGVFRKIQDFITVN